MNNEMGARMKQLRKNLKLSQAVVAEKAEISQATIAKIERGSLNPSLQYLIWYADYFDVSLDYLCCRTDRPEGRLYENNPKIDVDSKELKHFIDLCFDPDSPVSKKMKQTLFEIVEGHGE